MPEIVFPLSTAPGINPTESGGRLINAYALPAPAGSRSQVLWRRCAGLRDATSAGAGLHRGTLKFGSELIVINGDTAYSITKSGGAYSVNALTGTVPGTGPVIMARNMRTTPQIIVIHSAGMSKIVSSTVSDFTDADLPQANSVAFLDSYFIFGIGDGRMFASGVNDVTVASTDYTTAEARPDGLVRAVASGRDLLAFGATSLEFYGNAGNETGFPLSRGPVLPVGLLGVYALAGFEEGWTDDLIFVANDRSVRRVVGYEAARISEPDLERLIAAVEDTSTLIATAYIADGNPIVSLSCPAWTWEYNLATNRWHERKSLGELNWRGRYAVNAFDEWLICDEASTSIFRIDPAFQRESDTQIVWELRSTQAHRFPGRATINRASFDFKTGVGIATGEDPIETDPQVQISWSDDGGVTFGNPVFRRLGGQGEITAIDVFKAGMVPRLGRQWKLIVADPVETVFYGGAMDIEERAA